MLNTVELQVMCYLQLTVELRENIGSSITAKATMLQNELTKRVSVKK